MSKLTLQQFRATRVAQSIKPSEALKNGLPRHFTELMLYEDYYCIVCLPKGLFHLPLSSGDETSTDLEYLERLLYLHVYL